MTDDVLRTLVLTDEQAHAAIREQSGLDTRSLAFHTIPDQRTTVEGDVQRIRSFPYLPSDLQVIGCDYDVATGAVEVVVPLP